MNSEGYPYSVVNISNSYLLNINKPSMELAIVNRDACFLTGRFTNNSLQGAATIYISNMNNVEK